MFVVQNLIGLKFLFCKQLIRKTCKVYVTEGFSTPAKKSLKVTLIILGQAGCQVVKIVGFYVDNIRKISTVVFYRGHVINLEQI